MDSKSLQFLSLLSNILHCREIGRTEDIDWQYVYEESVNQAIVPLIVGSAGMGLFGENGARVMGDFCQNLKLYHEILAEQDRLETLLSSNGISYAVMKGCAVSRYYPHPEHRSMGDIDLIIESSRFADAASIFEEAGYRTIQTLEDNPRHIEIISPRGVIIEPHIQFSKSNSSKYDAILNQMIADAIPKSELVSLDGHNVRVLPELENGIILLFHINFHLSAGLGLRQIIDWMYFVENVLTDEFWGNSYKSAIESVGLNTLAKVVTCMCKKYLGLNSTATWYLDEMDSELVDEFAEYVLNHGNFGRKDSDKTKVTVVMRASRNPIRLLALAQQRGKINWPAVKKHPWLKPLAWLYQICIWVSKWFKSKYKVSDLNDLGSDEKRERDFLERLGVTRY